MRATLIALAVLLSGCGRAEPPAVWGNGAYVLNTERQACEYFTFYDDGRWNQILEWPIRPDGSCHSEDAPGVTTGSFVIGPSETNARPICSQSWVPPGHSWEDCICEWNADRTGPEVQCRERELWP